jgi:Plasmid recombination enzyme/Toprim-like
MEQYAVLHITKFKELGGIGAHLDRQYVQHNVDDSRSHLNEELSLWGQMELNTAIENRIQEGYKKQKAIRHDAVLAVGVMLTGSHEQMKRIESDPNLFNEWKQKNYEFACENFGMSNIVRFSVHRDEKTPHIHCVFVPITEEGGLSAKSYTGGKEQLQAYQDDYVKVMEKFGLSRGISKEITQEAHISTSDYYRETNKLIQEVATKTEQIKPSNILSLKQVRQSVQEEMTRGYRLALDYQKKAEKHERMYKSVSEELINQDLERVKREVNLVQHLSSMGYCLDKEKSCRTYAVMEKEADKLIVRTSPKNETGHWVYMSATDSQDKGTIVDLMLNRGYTYEHIRGLKSGHLDDTVWKQACSEQKAHITDKEIQKKLALGRLSGTQIVSNRENYLEKRGIGASTYSTYEGNGMKVGLQAVFGLYQELSHHGDGRLCSTISYYFTEPGESRKNFQIGLPRGLSVLKENNSSDKIIITESPIDALSHKQLHGGNATYMCTCGNLTAQIKEELKVVMEGARLYNKEVFLSFDNDKAGKIMSNQVTEICKVSGITPQSVQPLIGKDWNEELMQKRGIRIGRGMSL